MRALVHLLGLVADRYDLPGGSVERDDARLIQDDAPPPYIDQGVGGAEIDGRIGSEIEDTHGGTAG